MTRELKFIKRGGIKVEFLTNEQRALLMVEVLFAEALWDGEDIPSIVRISRDMPELGQAMRTLGYKHLTPALFQAFVSSGALAAEAPKTFAPEHDDRKLMEFARHD